MTSPTQGDFVLPIKNKYRIHFVITGLGAGGAEMMLYKVLSEINRDLFDPKVISLLNIETLRSKFEQIDIPVEILGMKPGVPDPLGLLKLAKLFRKERPHLVQTWMYHADLLGGLAGRLAGNIPVVWNIRHSNLDPLIDKKSTLWTAKLCGMMSSVLPQKIICCAETAKEIHGKIGYDTRKIIVVPNGFNLSEFSPDSQARERISAELAIPPESVIIGLVGRFHPQKDHKCFFEAAELLTKRIEKVHFVLCGDGISYENPDILKLFNGKNLEGNLHLLGRRADMPALTATFDIATSSSRCGEAFSNTIGEAMACGVPAVVTDVGDSGFIVGKTGKVVSPGKPHELCQAWEELIEFGQEGRIRLGSLARERVQDHFSLAAIVSRYEKVYFDILGSRSTFEKMALEEG
jgi:glycosyltransferase involved in cell wall biosynthesis